MDAKIQTFIDFDDAFDAIKDLTPAQLRVFKALCESENFGKPVGELANEYGFSESANKRLPKDVKALAKKICLAKMLSDISDVTTSFVDKAKSGSFNHQKLLYEMTGVYTPKQETTNNNVNTNVVDENTKEMLSTVLERLGK